MLVQQLESQGVRLKTDGETLSIKIEGGPSDDQLQFLKKHKFQLISELQHALTNKQESQIRLWLEHIEETDSDLITEVVERCQRDSDAREYFLLRSKEVSIPAIRWVTCGDCMYYERIGSQHLGHCIKGQPEDITGLWDAEKRCCSYWLPLLKQ